VLLSENKSIRLKEVDYVEKEERADVDTGMKFKPVPCLLPCVHDDQFFSYRSNKVMTLTGF